MVSGSHRRRFARSPLHLIWNPPIYQAIEFPFPHDDGRRKLIQLYSRSIEVPEDVEDLALKKTEGVSVSFIKELMRRSAQFYLERGSTMASNREYVENALEELLFSGGSLIRRRAISASLRRLAGVWNSEISTTGDSLPQIAGKLTIASIAEWEGDVVRLVLAA